MKVIVDRLIGAAAMDAETFEEIEADATSNCTAVLVVLVASVAAAIGVGATDLAGIAAVTIASFLSWMIWIGLTLLIGKWMMPDPATRTNFGEILRTTGFSATPGVLRALAAVPFFGLPLFFAVTIWMLFSFVAAIRQALDYASFYRALAVCLLGWTIHGVLFFGFVIVTL